MAKPEKVPSPEMVEDQMRFAIQRIRKKLSEPDQKPDKVDVATGHTPKNEPGKERSATLHSSSAV
jgi:hypothetical protein